MSASMLKLLVVIPVLAALADSQIPLVRDSHCPLDSPLSCHINRPITNTCCTEVQGQVLSVQFWDSNPATGPEDSWTIHGLWPDNCDGSYEQYCDHSRRYTNVSCILDAAGPRGKDIKHFMETYWKDQYGHDDRLWEHEWNKHGSCYSTLRPECFQDYEPQQEVVDYFDQATRLFRELPTFEYLKAAGIVPSVRKRYSYDDFVAALKLPSGIIALPRCRYGQVNEVWYTYGVRGSIADGTYERVEPVGQGVGCPRSFYYLPKKMDTAPTPRPTTCQVSEATATAPST